MREIISVYSSKENQKSIMIVKNDMEKNKTLVIGASLKPERYSNKAVKMLTKFGHDVVAFGRRTGDIPPWTIVTEFPERDDIQTVTLYLNPNNQLPYYEAILALKPVRIIFNPGTENPELQSLANEAKIETVEACTLVMLSTDQYDLELISD